MDPGRVAPACRLFGRARGQAGPRCPEGPTSTGVTMSLPRAPAAVVFDIDGLLFDTERLYQEALHIAAAEAGHEVVPDFFNRTLGLPWPECRRYCHLWMPPALQAVLTSSGLTLGLQSSIRPLTRSVTAGPGGIRGSAPHHGIELRRSDNASGLADPGCPVSPSLRHHPRNPVRSCGWLSRQRRPPPGISRRGSAWPRRCARSC